jgi:hypothetical protein
MTEDIFCSASLFVFNPHHLIYCLHCHYWVPRAQVSALMRSKEHKTALYTQALELHRAGQLGRACAKYSEAVAVGRSFSMS